MTDLMPGNISCFHHNMEEVDLELLMLLFLRNVSISLLKILSPFTVSWLQTIVTLKAGSSTTIADW